MTFIAAATTMSAAAQHEVKVDFESASACKAVGIYDTWAESPFRTGKMKGNVAVVDNFTRSDARVSGNASARILGVQRSRFGSNTFGARIDLNRPFGISPEYQYVHVKLLTPHEGRVMLVGLGKRTDRAGQSAEAEQFWAYAESELKVGEWCDAVFPVKGNAGVEIHSLVFVPDCSSPHNLKSDFVAYIDDIELSADAQPRLQVAAQGAGETAVATDGMVTLSAGSRNGYLTDAAGGDLTSVKAARGKAFMVKAHAAPGFRLDYMMVRHGNLTTGKYKEERVEAAQFATDGTFSIPAAWVDGDVNIEAQFASAENK